ncbi:MAG: Maf family protein [Acidobacteria bacterium]|nr:Maf family protein [Acidobacteriota bacterium]
MVLVLASRSPRRQEILERAGFAFVVRPADVDESTEEGEDPAEHVRRLSRDKAMAVECAEGETVLGADTVVVAGGEILGKPRDAEDAARMLRMLSGREHQVLTGICLRTPRRHIVDIESTRVWFRPLSAVHIGDYIASGEPMDKAGAYAIQGLASKFIPRIEGCYFNVVGLPAAKVAAHLESLRDRDRR